jgi:hypothetical protein
MNCNRELFPFPRRSSNPTAQALWDWCWPARERSWALRAISRLHREDAAALCERSERLIAHSIRLRYPRPRTPYEALDGLSLSRGSGAVPV